MPLESATTQVGMASAVSRVLEAQQEKSITVRRKWFVTNCLLHDEGRGLLPELVIIRKAVVHG